MHDLFVRCCKAAKHLTSLRHRVHERGQLHIPLTETLGIVGGERDLDPVVNVEPLGMMIHLVRLERTAGHEAEGGIEIRKLKRALNGVTVLNLGPARQLRQGSLARFGR